MRAPHSWPDHRIQHLLGLEHPIIQAPMAGAAFGDMALAVAQAGGLGSLACAMLTAEQIRAEVALFRQGTKHPLNLNFFCHQNPPANPERDTRWKQRLAPYYCELGLDPTAPTPVSSRAPFDKAVCELVEELEPEVVSFHFGLPEKSLLTRVKATGAKILSSATTVEEALWLEAHGCDAIIAQGVEAGGHRGMFLTQDVSTQIGTLALVPQIVDAVSVPVIASGGISDARGIIAVLTLGAAAVQLGTVYLLSPESRISPLHRAALQKGTAHETALTNVFTGRPARSIVNRLVREVGPISADAPDFPLAGGALAPLRAASEPAGSADFMSLWSGQAASLARALPAGEITRRLAEKVLARL